MLYNPYIRYVKTNYLFLLILTSTSAFSQNNFVSDEEFNSKITWLEPHEVHLEFRDVLRKIPGANFEFTNINININPVILPTKNGMEFFSIK